MKNERYYEKEFANKFGKDFAQELEALLDKHNIEDSKLIKECWNILQDIYDRDDVESWLWDSSYPSLANNEKFVDELVYTAQKYWDADIGTWDNINNAFNFLCDFPEWKDIIEAAYNEEE